MRIGIAIILFSFAALYFVPQLIQKNNFSFPASHKSRSINILMDQPLTFVNQKEKTTTLRELLKTHPAGLVVNFWATWCAPCLEELPSFESLNRYLNKADLPLVVTIAEDDSISAVPELFKTLDFKPTFVALHDKDGAVVQAIGTNKFPETYWISSQGEILYKWIGPQNWMAEDVLKLFAPRG